MSLTNPSYRLKAQAGQSNPVDEKGGATLTGSTQTLVDRGAGDMAWQFAAGISSAAIPSKTTAPLTPGGGVTVARKIRIKNYGTLDYMVLMGIGSAAVGAGDTFPGNGLVLNKTASGYVQSAQKDSAYTPQFALPVDTVPEITIVTRYTAAQAGYILIENWYTGGTGTAGANTSDSKSAPTNVAAQTFNTLSINASNGAIYQISDYVIWNEELTDAQCRAVATDLRGTIDVVPTNLVAAAMSGGSTIATGAVGYTAPPAGTNLIAAAMSGGSTIATGAVTYAAPTVKVTTDAFTAWGDPTPLASLTIPHALVVSLDGSTSIYFANPVTDSLGRLALTGAFTSGAWYGVATWADTGIGTAFHNRGLKFFQAA